MGNGADHHPELVVSARQAEGRGVVVALWVLAGIAASVLVGALVIGAIVGPFSGWLLVGPLPFFAVGVAAFWRRPDSLPIRWLLLTGCGFTMESSLAAFLTWADGTGAWLPVLALLRHWASLASSFGGLGLITTFPSGRPEGLVERLVLAAAGAEAALLPVLNALSSPTLVLGQFADASEPAVLSPVAVPALAWLGPVTATLYQLYPLWVVVGVFLLALRYRRGPDSRRLRIRWLLVGWMASVFTWVPLLVLPAPSEPPSFAVVVAATLAWPLTQLLALGSVLVALFQDGVFGIDEPARRRAARSAVRLLVGLLIALAAIGLGLLAGRSGGVAAAAIVAVGAMLAARPVWARLERSADRWFFGSRLDGYDLLAGFGASLGSAPTPAALTSELAATLHAGLGLSWVTVTLDPPIDATVTTGEVGDLPGTVVPISSAGDVVGSISAGPRHDGPLLDEDLRLLGLLAAQAGAAASALRLSAELAERLDVIRSQAAELAASRDRVVEGQDAERRRIQRDLHDGIQQELVAFSAKVSLAQQRLHRGDATVDTALAELQRDVGTLLADVREFAYTIHPPVLTDRGLVEAVEAQAARLPVPTRVRADGGLRAARLPERVEAAAWYSVSEAMSNVVKHAHAANSEVTLHRDDGQLEIAVRDDGCGFDPDGPRGLGLTGLADRLDTVGGTFSVHSRPGAGTVLAMQIPLAGEAADD